MNVVIVNQHKDDSVGGSELQCDFIANGLLERAHEVVYVAPTKNPDFVSNTKYKLVKIRNCSEAIVASVLLAEPDVVYWRYNKKHLLNVARALKQNDIPLVFAVSHVNDVLRWPKRPYSFVRSNGLHHLIKVRRQYSGFKYASALTSNNEDYLRLSPVEKKYYIPNGMTRAVVPFRYNKPYIMWVANIKASKRPEVTVRLAASLAEDGVDVLMVGNIQSSDYDWLRSTENLPTNFKYLGSKTVEEVNGMLAGSLLHVHTCYPEGFPNIFIQAWMQAKPTVSFGFDPDGLISGESLGFACNNDYKRFVDSVRCLVASQRLREEMGTNAKRYAIERFDMARLVTSVEKVLADVAR